MVQTELSSLALGHCVTAANDQVFVMKGYWLQFSARSPEAGVSLRYPVLMSSEQQHLSPRPPQRGVHLSKVPLVNTVTVTNFSLS